MHSSSSLLFFASSPRNLDVGWAKDLATTLFLGEDKVHEDVARKKAATQRMKNNRRKWTPCTRALFRFGDRFKYDPKENHSDLSVTAVNAASDEAEAKTASRASGAAASTDQISRRSESIIESLTYEFRQCNEG